MTAKEGATGARIETFRNAISTLSKRKSVRYGIPFLLFIVGGSFGLREWTQIRFVQQLSATTKLTGIQPESPTKTPYFYSIEKRIQLMLPAFTFVWNGLPFILKDNMYL